MERLRVQYKEKRARTYSKYKFTKKEMLRQKQFFWKKTLILINFLILCSTKGYFEG